MDLPSAHQTFLRDEFHGLVLQATLQRARVYAPGLSERVHERFRAGLRDVLEGTASDYALTVGEPQHLVRIADLAKRMSADHSEALRGGRFRIGPAQKALNLFLKYLWCMGWIPTPPHCPFDARIIGRLPTRDRVNWTTLDDLAQYQGLVVAARGLAGSKSLAEWELYEYNSLSTVATRQPKRPLNLPGRAG